MKRSHLIAGLVALVAICWIVTFRIVGADSGNTEPRPVATATRTATPKQVEATAQNVRVALSIAERRQRDVVVRGRTAVEKKVEIKSEAQARVVELPAPKGTRVKKGQIVAKLAVDDRIDRLNEAKAMMRLREVELSAGQELAAKGYRPTNKLRENEAMYDAARAMVARMEMEISKLTIAAPFDGVIEELPVELGAFLKVGDPVATLVAQDPFLVIGQVSERDIGQLRLGGEGHAELATGERVTGKIRFIATTAEAATRTFRVELEVPNKSGSLRDGITAEMRLGVQAVQAHRLSPQALTLNDSGVVGLRAVNAANRVEFHPAEILSEGLDGVWIGGLPERLSVIVVGQDFVKEGQTVVPVPMNALSTN